MKVWAVLDSTEALHVCPAVTVLAPCAGVRRTSSVREANIVAGMGGERCIVDATHMDQKLRFVYLESFGVLTIHIHPLEDTTLDSSQNACRA